VEKVACWSTKAAISVKRVKIEEKLLRRAYRNSLTLFRTVPTPTPYGLLFPKIGGSQPSPQLQSLLSQEGVNSYGFKFGWYIHSSIRTKAIKNFVEKGAWAYPGTAQIFSGKVAVMGL